MVERNVPHAVADPRSPEEAPIFRAVLSPHRSLSPQGFRVLMLAFGGSSLAIGLVFVGLGAWPVFGFLGLDVAALYWVFRLNYRGAHAYEAVELTASVLTVERVDPRGHRVVARFAPPHWLMVSIADRPDAASTLTLSSHGRSITIGGFLSPEERRDLAASLRSALASLARGQG